jgi:hypothetical protein
MISVFTGIVITVAIVFLVWLTRDYYMRSIRVESGTVVFTEKNGRLFRRLNQGWYLLYRGEALVCRRWWRGRAKYSVPAYSTCSSRPQVTETGPIAAYTSDGVQVAMSIVVNWHVVETSLVSGARSDRDFVMFQACGAYSDCDYRERQQQQQHPRYRAARFDDDDDDVDDGGGGDSSKGATLAAGCARRAAMPRVSAPYSYPPNSPDAYVSAVIAECAVSVVAAKSSESAWKETKMSKEIRDEMKESRAMEDVGIIVDSIRVTLLCVPENRADLDKRSRRESDVAAAEAAAQSAAFEARSRVVCSKAVDLYRALTDTLSPGGVAAAMPKEGAVQVVAAFVSAAPKFFSLGSPC